MTPEPKLAHGARLTKIKAISLSKNQRGLRINVDGGYVLITRDAKGCVIWIEATNDVLHVDEATDKHVKIEVTK